MMASGLELSPARGEDGGNTGFLTRENQSDQQTEPDRGETKFHTTVDDQEHPGNEQASGGNPEQPTDPCGSPASPASSTGLVSAVTLFAGAAGRVPQVAEL